MKYYIIFFILFILCNYNCKDTKEIHKKNIEHKELSITNPQTTSLLGRPLSSAQPSETLTKRWQEKYRNFLKDSTDIDNIIWHGRFTAYMGDYLEAIKIYSKGINRFPNDARLYRHRGHRYITLRQFDMAIKDFEKAKELIAGTENEIEPDGMPNAENIPVSSLHGNIYYHLGLAYYLNGDRPNALKAYTSCLNTSRMPDNTVSASHWLYTINRLMGREREAFEIVKDIDANMEIIENHSYHNLCLLYNGTLNEDEGLLPEESSSANDAVKYGVATWHIYNGRKEKGKEMLREIVKGDSWASFGFIAAEADLARIRS